MYVRGNSPKTLPIEANLNNREVNFFAVGRQGYKNKPTREIADSMEAIAAERKNMGFTVLLGDNFYPKGVPSTTDRQWKTKFEHLYRGPYQLAVPFFVVFGNHDRQGNNAEAQLKYAEDNVGSGRWEIDAPFYSRDFGEVDGRPLVRIVFLDSVLLYNVDTGEKSKQEETTREEQLEFIRTSFLEDEEQPYWQIVASHYPFRSETQHPFSQKRVMRDLLPLLKEAGVDLVISSNDRFQQVLDRPGEPLHVSTNGGGSKLESIEAVETSSEFIKSQNGFAAVSVTSDRILVELYRYDGSLAYSANRLFQEKAREETADIR